MKTFGKVLEELERSQDLTEALVGASNKSGLVSAFFSTRDQTHYWHLQTRSYAVHNALGAYYEGILDIGDRFLESYQGVVGDRISGPITISLIDYSEIALNDHLNEFKGIIGEIRPAVSPFKDLLAILDEAEELVNKTLYLLTLK